MNRWPRVLAIAGLAAGLLAGCPAPPPPKFTVAYTLYVGDLPWQYAADSGILDKWADAYGIEIELVRREYIPSVEAFVREELEAVSMTSLECLNMPAAAGVDSSAIIISMYSDGTDALFTRGGFGIGELPGKTVYLAKLSILHYLLARALEMHGLDEGVLTIEDIPDPGPDLIADPAVDAVATWHPMVMAFEQSPDFSMVFSSADIPGEILDLMVVRTEVLREHPELGMALAGAWYEVMAVLSGGGEEAAAAIRAMAEIAAGSVAEFEHQLATLKIFSTPQEALDYAWSLDLPDTMNFIRSFSFDHGLVGLGLLFEDVVGIRYPDATVQGNGQNVRMRFDATYMQMAADGELEAP